MINVKLICFIVFVFCFSSIKSQDPVSFKITKNEGSIIFFGKDTLLSDLKSSKGKEFVLIIDDKLKPYLRIIIENGKMTQAKDSLVNINYTYGLNYESFYRKDENFSGGKQSYSFSFFTGIDGASYSEKGVLKIHFIDTRDNLPLLNNAFIIPD